MISRLTIALIAALALTTTAQAQTYSTGKDPRGRAVPIRVAPDGALTVSGTTPKTGAPNFSVSVSTVSAAATGLTAGSCFRLSCSGTVYWRTGTGTPTAVTTDNPMYGPATETPWCLPGTDTAVAFVTAAGTATCVASAVNGSP